MLEWDALWQPIKDALWHHHEFGKRAVLPVLFAGNSEHAPGLA